jgi:uridine phosphorylase
MVDFMVRESRAIVDGPLAIVRLGTCGTPNPAIPVGSIAIAKDSVMCYQNFDAFYDGQEKTKATDYYHLTKPLDCDPVLTEAVSVWRC